MKESPKWRRSSAEKRKLLGLLQVKAYCFFTCLLQENILRLEHEKKELADKRRKIRVGQKVPLEP